MVSVWDPVEMVSIWDPIGLLAVLDAAERVSVLDCVCIVSCCLGECQFWTHLGTDCQPNAVPLGQTGS